MQQRIDSCSRLRARTTLRGDSLVVKTTLRTIASIPPTSFYSTLSDLNLNKQGRLGKSLRRVEF